MNSNKCLDLTNGVTTNGNPVSDTSRPRLWIMIRLFCTAHSDPTLGLRSEKLESGLAWIRGTQCQNVRILDSLLSLDTDDRLPCISQPNSVVFGGPCELSCHPFHIIEILRLSTATSTDSLCMSASSNADGAAVTIDKCSTSASWSLPATPLTGQVKAFSNKCLDVKDGVNADGTKLQIWTCADGNTNQQWRTSSNGTLIWAGKNKCVDVSRVLLDFATSD